MCALGLPGWRFATSRDPDERALLMGMLKSARDEQRRHNEQLVGELLVKLGIAKRVNDGA